MKKTAITLLLIATVAASPMYADVGPNIGDSEHHAKKSRGDDEAEQDEGRVEQEENLYDEGTDALDDHDWGRAASQFTEVARMHMAHADGALYWLAYAQNKMGHRSEALNTILEMQKTYPKSRWKEDAKALEVEIRQAAGQQISPEHVDDEDLKLMALTGLMNSDPERAVPILDSLLNSAKTSPRIKDRALFVLSQSGSQQAVDILGRVAKNNNAPDLQARAVRYLGIMGGDRGRKVLAEVYSVATDVDVKKSVLKSYMIAGDKAHLLAAARGESNQELREDAVTQLGILGARNELAEMYASESTVEIKKKIIQAMFIGGNSEKLAEIARGEKVLELRLAAIRNLGLLGGSKSGQLLVNIYDSDSRAEVRAAIIKSLFIQGNASAMVSIARREKDPQLKKEIVSKLALMRSKEATDYLMEFLKE